MSKINLIQRPIFIQDFKRKHVLAQKPSQALQKNHKFDLIECFGSQGSILTRKGSSLGPTVSMHVFQESRRSHYKKGRLDLSL